MRNSAHDVNDPSFECISGRRARREKDTRRESTAITQEMNSLLSSYILAGCARASGSSVVVIRDNKAVASEAQQNAEPHCSTRENRSRH